LFNGEVQPGVENPVKQHVIVPVEYFRNQQEIEQTMREVRYQEDRIARALSFMESAFIEPLNNDEKLRILESTFPHDRSQCFWMKGEVCEYNDLCWKPEVRSNPLENGYEVRQPHHETEV
jgi:hypothetical protein